MLRLAPKLASLLLAATALGAPGRAQETTVWLADVEGGQLYHSAKNDLAGTLSSVAALPAGTMAVDLDASGGELWLVRNSVGPLPEAGTIDLATGEYTQRGRNLPFSSADALAVAPTGEAWYAVENVGADARVWRGSLLHARMELVATVADAAPVTAIAVDLSGQVIAFSDVRDEVVAIDPVAGTAAVLSTTSLPGALQDWDFDWATGELLGVLRSGASGAAFVAVDAASGEVTVLEDLTGIGIAPQVAIQRSGKVIRTTRICGPAVPNASGASAELRARGSVRLGLGDVTLVAESMPTNTFGLVLASLDRGAGVTPPGAIGELCLGGAIGRIATPGGLLSTGPAGSFAVTLDVNAIPQPAGPVAAEAWSAWNFQAWFRDSSQGAATSNFSDAILVPLQDRIERTPYKHETIQGNVDWLRFADMNGDGVTELITVEPLGSNGVVKVLARDQNDDFTQVLGQRVSNWRGEFTLGDLDGDGDLDLAMATNSQRLAVLLNTGAGGLIPGVRIQVCETDMQDVLIADFDGDGSNDVSCSCFNGNRTELLLGTGGGVLADPITLQAGGTDFAGQVFGAGDVNGDGAVDLIGVSSPGGLLEAQYMEGLGGGVFAAPVGYPSLLVPKRVLVDVTGDGRDDLVEVTPLSQSTDTVRVRPGLVSGGFGAAIMTPMIGRLALEGVHDVDGDGRADLIGAARESGNTIGTTVFWLRSLGNGQFEQIVLSEDHADSVVFLDGMTAVSGTLQAGDLILARIADTRAYELARIGATSGTNQTALTTSISGTAQTGDPFEILLEDFDGDGIQDAVLTVPTLPTQAGIQVRPGLGDGRFGPGMDVDFVQVRGIRTADIDADGDTDITSHNFVSGAGWSANVYRNTGGQFALHASIPSVVQIRAHALGDVNEDGRLDILAHSNDGIAVSLQDANGDFGGFQVVISGFSSGKLEVADFDRDGHIDAVAEVSNLGVVIYYGVEGLGFEPPVSVALFTRSMEIVDMNGDGVEDIVLGAGYDEVLRVLTTLPGRDFATFVIDVRAQFPDAPYATEIDSADINGDDLPDLVIGTLREAILVYENLGHGRIGNPYAYKMLPDTGNPTESLKWRSALADVNGDGAIDLVRYVPYKDRIESRLHRGR